MTAVTMLAAEWEGFHRGAVRPVRQDGCSWWICARRAV